ncbi:MAG: class I SAM-dependent methyltransferase [Sediminimonas qiaohouensis]|uniref:Class I SAM-dependent methyltransferase n=1 Tax=Sediminimonas qiaohouensis TaxID=552061 RepID=A0A7C9HDF0_9RHOB|nr:class I SAM-dependent methyltransferase [Sediminimonas qiaohouensis]MTJ06085.1 class I SAM-dependent methyltransferase [Sediminimonas qiaohouensis]
MPILKRFERYISAFFKLGRIERIAKHTAVRTEELAGRTEELAGRTENTEQRLRQEMETVSDSIRQAIDEKIGAQDAWAKGRFAEQSLHNSELSRRLDRLFLGYSEAAVQTADQGQSQHTPAPSEGFQLFMDTFYNRLENKFRGSREDILNRLRVYQPDVEAAVIRTEGKPVLDLGCGRGEWLQLMRALEIRASGVDLNTAQIAEAEEAGLNVEKLDARTALAKADDNSLSVISAHHLIEHIPFTDVAWIAREALRVLAPGGLLIFETPNPRNVLVGATSFHNDPTHLRPLTDPVLSVLFETAGYHPVETRFLHPHERLDEFQARPGFDPELAHLLFGPQDLAMIGQKPRETP